MAVTVEEKYRSRRLGRDRAEIGYIVRGTDDDVTARNAAEAEAPTSYDGKLYVDTEIIELGPNVWEATALYETNQVSQPGDSASSFEIGVSPQHITQSRSTISATAPAGETAPDFDGAIGVTHDSVEGVDIDSPTYTFTERRTVSAATVTNAYKYQIFDLVGKINDALFFGLAAGECLFLGASGQENADGDYDIDFRFAGSKNAVNIVIGDITVPAKGGWEYLWVLYEDQEDATAKRIVKRPIAAYVEQVRESGNFSLLGIGTS